MKKQLFPLFLCILALPLTGCGGGGKKDPLEDATKVNIKVGTVNLGFGKAWLESAADKYMKLHENDKYGDKTGVNVIIVDTVDSVYPRDSSLVASDDIDIHLRENVSYTSFAKSGDLLDISDVLKEENPYDGKTIYSKLSNDDKELYAVNGGMYAAPFYSGSYGIIYNKQVFKDNKLYIAATSPKDATRASDVVFIKSSGAKKSAGYNGVSGDYDDGLPATYAEFEAVLKQAARCDDVVPIAWSADYREQYLTYMLTSALSSDLGYEQAKLRFSFDGTATNLGKIVGGTFVKDSTPTKITNGNQGNGYELARSESVYNSLQFLELITKDKTNYPSEDTGSSGFNHYSLQESMVNGYTKGNETKSIAMCIEGTWFENECAKHISGYDELGMEFGFMPIPKKTFEGVTDRKYIYNDHSSSCAFIKGNISDSTRKEVAKDFFKFFYSDAQLLDFSSITKAMISVNYPEISKDSEEYLALGSFGQSLYDLYTSSYRINYNYPNDFYTNNKLRVFDRFTFSTANTKNPVPSFVDGKKTAQTYFEDMASYFTKSMWNNLSE